MEGKQAIMNLGAIFLVTVLFECFVDSVRVDGKTFNMAGEKFMDADFSFGQRNPSGEGFGHGHVHGHCNLNASFIRSCGVKPLVNTKHYDSEEAAFGEFSHHVAIIHSTHKKFVCSGALLDERHVITAARCVDDLPIGEIKLRIGEWDIMNDKNLQEVYHSVERTCSKVYIHPSYLPKELYGHYLYDVAILRMAEPIDFNLVPHVSPICLPEVEIFDPLDLFGNLFYSNKMECYVAGWSESPVFMLQASYDGQVVVKDVYQGFKKRSSQLGDVSGSGPSSDYPADSGSEQVAHETLKTSGNIVKRSASATSRRTEEPSKTTTTTTTAADDEDEQDIHDEEGGSDEADNKDEVDSLKAPNTSTNSSESKAALRASATLSTSLKKRALKLEKKLQKRSPGAPPNTRAFLDSHYVTEYSRILNKARISRIEGGECTNQGAVEREFVDFGVCLTAKKGNDACKADIGSPVVCLQKPKLNRPDSLNFDFGSTPAFGDKNPVNKFVMVGVVSDTSLCTVNSGYKRKPITAISLHGILDFICDVLSSPHF